MRDPVVFGRRIYFLYPPKNLDEILKTLVINEYEVYAVRNHDKLRQLLKNEGQAIVFINIDEGLTEPLWQDYIQSILNTPETKEVKIGILSLNANPELKKKYLIDMGLPCGFVTMRLGVKESTQILLKTLEANEAKGRRKYIRANCNPGSAEFNAKVDGKFLHGDIRDLSSVGMSCSFRDTTSFYAGKKLPDTQLSLRGTRISIAGVIVARRDNEDGIPTYVVIFEPAALTEDVRYKLHESIFKLLQADMEKLLSDI
jgi:hypothetical protein